MQSKIRPSLSYKKRTFPVIYHNMYPDYFFYKEARNDIGEYEP